MFRLDDNDHLLARVEASQAQLDKGEWALDDARVIQPGAVCRSRRRRLLPADRSDRGSGAGEFRAAGYAVGVGTARVHCAARALGLLVDPPPAAFPGAAGAAAAAGTMALVAAGFSMRPSRRGGVARMIGGGVAAGFALFVVSKVAEEFGQSGVLPVVLAAWAPTAAGLMLAVALLLHMEDG